jgi:hypothetical protein
MQFCWKALLPAPVAGRLRTCCSSIRVTQRPAAISQVDLVLSHCLAHMRHRRMPLAMSVHACA